MTSPAFGRYQVLSMLGSGGMGQVFLAEDTSLGRRVAVKVLPASAAGDQARIGRLVQEARLASALSHPNIAQIFEIGDADGTPFIAMEYVEGEPLTAVIARGPVTQRELIEIGKQLFDAI